MNEEWRAHLKSIAPKGGNAHKEKKDYFKKIRAKRKHYPKRKKTLSTPTK